MSLEFVYALDEMEMELFSRDGPEMVNLGRLTFRDSGGDQKPRPDLLQEFLRRTGFYAA